MSDAGSKASLLGVHWASRVNPILIRRLYQTDARGIVDEELIDAVGFALYARCESILQATEAHAGHIICPECGTLVKRDGGPWLKDAILECAQCGWQVPWEEYFKTYQHKHLVGGSPSHSTLSTSTASSMPARRKRKCWQSIGSSTRTIGS